MIRPPPGTWSTRLAGLHALLFQRPNCLGDSCLPPFLHQGCSWCVFIRHFWYRHVERGRPCCERPQEAAESRHTYAPTTFLQESTLRCGQFRRTHKTTGQKSHERISRCKCWNEASLPSRAGNVQFSNLRSQCEPSSTEKLETIEAIDEAQTVCSAQEQRT